MVPQTNVIKEIRPVLLFTLYNTKNIAYIPQKSWYFMQTKLWLWAIPKICMYLISRFYWNHENRKNLMLAKYTCFTVCTFVSVIPHVVQYFTSFSAIYSPLSSCQHDVGRRSIDQNVQLSVRSKNDVLNVALFK